jgi:hypothetical protein
MHSKLLNFSCPQRYEKLHILNLADTSDPARRGSTVHRANEVYLAALVKRGAVSDFEVADAALQQAIVDETCPAHLVPDCEYLWRNHVETFELDVNAYLEAETRKVVGPFSFKPDYVYAKPGALEIHDLKTLYVSLTEEGAKRDFQARMYAYLARETWPHFPLYRFVFHFIRLRQVIAVDFTPDDLDKVGRQLEAHAAGIREAIATDTWPAAPGQQCAYCNFACAAVDDANRMPARILSQQDAEQMASDLIVLRQHVAAKLRVLQEYCGLNGAVSAAEHEWAHRPAETLSFPVEQTVDVLKQYGADMTKVSIGKTALKSFLTSRKWANLAPLLEALAQKKATTRFSAKKLGVAQDEDESYA